MPTRMHELKTVLCGLFERRQENGGSRGNEVGLLKREFHILEM